MNQYNFLNKTLGWVVFAISAITYVLTCEDTASFWDCGEFIAVSNKLLVGHPPGNPFFMIVGRLFTLFAPAAEYVAISVNIMSALCSAFTILFLFWSITHLAKKIFLRSAQEEAEKWRTWAVMGAGVVGSLAYTFSDTFWFSAVEGEVYAMSSLFTAVVFWAILRWEDEADEPIANRWIILIAYLMGLSIGVHLLNLLAIPAIVMVYYFRKYTPTTKGVITALVISGITLLAILYGIIPGTIKLAGQFELFFVNSLGTGYHAGALVFAFLLIAALVWGIYYTYKNGKVLANTIITAVAVIIIGYSSVAMVLIRSNSNPTMDENSPNDMFSLIDYLNREQYGDRPLFYGQSFASPLDRKKTDYQAKPVYIQRNGRYEVADHRPAYVYQANMLFPRMHSNDRNHIEQYKQWSNFTGRPTQVVDERGSVSTVTVPTQLENIRFFLSYQCNFMYWRYFMWNFSGRQNDIQGHGEITHGNWITGISFIDNLMLGDQDLLPDYLKENKGHNTYFMLPFLLGLLGLFFQYGRGSQGKQGFWVVMLLFFLTGLAIVMYLNQSPLQPRERDYAYAGSFYAFAIWIGLGVLGVVEALRRLLRNPLVATAVATIVCLLAVPTLMAQQNWDDHDRSGCTIARDMAYNYLNSCEENAVIFTNGDNDTFPLWYIQEVEGVRTDVRVCNLSYLQTGWYVDQMKRRSYQSAPLPISFEHDDYTCNRDVVYLFGEPKESAIDLRLALDFVRDDTDVTKRLQGVSDRICYIPTKTFRLPEVVSYNDEELDTVEFSINKQHIFKNELMVLDLLNNGTRPLYFATTVGPDNFAGLDDMFRLTGMAYKIVPCKVPSDALDKNYSGIVDVETMYDNVMNKFVWGSYRKEGIYLDENKIRMASNIRSNLARLAYALYNNNDDARAVEILDKVEYELPGSVIPHNSYSFDLPTLYYAIAIEADSTSNLAQELYLKGDKISKELMDMSLQELQYYTSLSTERFIPLANEARRSMYVFNHMCMIAERIGGRTELVKEYQKKYAESVQLRLDYYFGNK